LEQARRAGATGFNSPLRSSLGSYKMSRARESVVLQFSFEILSMSTWPGWRQLKLGHLQFSFEIFHEIRIRYGEDNARLPSILL